ncbi:glutamate-5-semialdehyde dehydrogenase [Leucobacter sp. M11]|uniref:glutamate-5-semialdehyde dehydrogenase n=1 Tax=Leucobacter sp. M11 TaxID=2993565 RepID=UPI002D7F46C0|nr:glutamate-5-semialdehyde dehydrogenase [Leucobacter sp. M11]MEB4616072.1 glutamate-5-semialdehyde dehydrogenase [Leucobacter sp. M11]
MTPENTAVAPVPAAPAAPAADALQAKLLAARDAARGLATLTTAQKNAGLEAIAAALEGAASAVRDENARDLAAGRENGLTEGILDRLLLTEERLGDLAAAVREIIALPDPVGTVLRGNALPNGLLLSQVRVPFGVVGAIYEARPNVTVDIAALALKSGNGVVLRGGTAAQHSNAALVALIRGALESAGISGECVQTIDEFGRDGANRLMRARGFVDVLIPRGSAELIRTVVEHATVPVIETGAGMVHIFLDATAEPQMALDIVRNAKTQRVGVCNAVETLLVHEDAAEALLPMLASMLLAEGVALRGCERARQLVPEMAAADEAEWTNEHLALELGVRVVPSLDAAVAHIDAYSTRHTEAIITRDYANAERFVAAVDSATVIVNASTRFTDGGEFGFGAEVGISTQKLHARGPMGLPELTSTKWIVRGSGQVRP